MHHLQHFEHSTLPWRDMHAVLVMRGVMRPQLLSMLPCCCVAALQIVQRMFCVTFPAGSTILLQNAQPSADDCMYYLAQGQAEVVIMGTVDAASKQGQGGSAGGCRCGVLGMLGRQVMR